MSLSFQSDCCPLNLCSDTVASVVSTSQALCKRLSEEASTLINPISAIFASLFGHTDTPSMGSSQMPVPPVADRKVDVVQAAQSSSAEIAVSNKVQKVVTLAYSPFMKHYPELQAVERALKEAIGPEGSVEHKEINENIPKSQRINGHALLIFSMRECHRPDDAENYKAFFEKKQKDSKGVILVRPREERVGEDLCEKYFKKIGANFVVCLHSNSNEEIRRELTKLLLNPSETSLSKNDESPK